MYKNLNPQSLGVSGRQSELIELTLTYGFRRLDLDAGELLKRATLHGVEEATRYIRSGKVKVSGWTLPVNLDADGETFDAELEKLSGLADTAAQVGFTYCTTKIAPSSDKPFHENFETHCERLRKAGEVLARHDIRLGIGFQPVVAENQDGEYPFVRQAEELLTLAKNVGSDNVGLALDTWDWQIGRGGKDQLSELTGQQIVSVCIADAPADAEAATVDPTQRLLPTEETAPGHTALLVLLAEREYDGPITLLPHSSQISRAPRDINVDKCANLLDGIWKEAGLNKAGKLVPVATED